MPPGVPATLEGQVLRDPLRVELTWAEASDAASAVSYRVYRNGTLIGTTSTTAWTNASVASGTTYTYSVRAIDSAGNLGEATPGVAVTTPDVVAPAAPASLTAQPLTGPARVELTWPAATDDVGVTGYELSRDGIVVATVTGTSYTDMSVAGMTTYTYAVVALDAAANRSAATTATATTPDLAPPSAPGSPAALAYGDRVELSWTASSDDVGVAAYDVYRDGSLVASVATTGYADRAVTQGRTYAYVVRARDAAGNTSADATVSATVPDVSPPSKPTGLAAQALSYPPRVRLTWSAAADNVAVAGYRIYRDGVLLASTSSRTFTDSAVARSRRYRYSVTAYDAANNASASSTSVYATTPKR
jgi:fibronectin type 3 domain-containing protein